MNRLELRTESRRLMAEQSTTKSFASDTDLNKWINEALKHMSIQGKVYQKTDTGYPIVDGVATYTLPWDFLAVEAIKRPDGMSLDYTTPFLASRQYIAAGKPYYYYVTQTPITSPTRANLTLYAKGVMLSPATANGFMYEVTTAGTSGAAPPTYPTDAGGIVTDGSCVLTCREFMTEIWAITFVGTPTNAGGGTGTYTLTYYALAQGIATDLDSPPFPVDKHHVIPIFVCMRWAEAKRQLNDSLYFAKEYALAMGIDLSSITGVPATKE